MYAINAESCQHGHTTILALTPEDMFVLHQALYAYCDYREVWWEKAGKPGKGNGTWHSMLEAREFLGAWGILVQPAAEWVNEQEDALDDEYDDIDEEPCPACGAAAGEPCDPTALEDFDEED